jgi:hypothetical protein
LDLYKKRQKNIIEDNTEDYRDVYALTAIENDTRLFKSIVVCV